MFVVWMQINARLAGILPHLGDRVILVGLVDDLGNQLWARLDQAGIRRR